MTTVCTQIVSRGIFVRISVSRLSLLSYLSQGRICEVPKRQIFLLLQAV